MTITAEKKSLLLYYDYKAHFDFLTDEQVGKIVRSMLEYEIDGVLPELDTPIMKMTFSFVKSNLDRDREKFFERCQKNAENGKKGGRPPKEEQPDTSQSYDNKGCYGAVDEETERKRSEFRQKYKSL